MSRMFLIPTPEGLKPMTTWNVYIGCRHFCSYCNARKAAETRFRRIARYRDGFEPKLVESELRRQFKPGEFVFVAYMGDISFATREETRLILMGIAHFPETSFLFCSKNPRVFSEWHLEFPTNLYLGTTLETNRDYHLSKAPPPLLRLQALAAIDWPKKFVSIEPIMDFNLEMFVSWLHWLKPAIIEVGGDNYSNGLPEPSGPKLADLLERLRRLHFTVVEKEGLERILKKEQ